MRRDHSVQRKDRVYEAVRALCTQRPAQSSVLRRHAGFSAEEVAEQASIDRTNASRDLNLLAQQGMVERIPGRPVLFCIKTSEQENGVAPTFGEQREVGKTELPISLQALAQKQPPLIVASVQGGAVVTSFETLIGHNEGLK